MTQIVTVLKFIGESANCLVKKLSKPDKEDVAGRLVVAMTNKEFAMRPPVIYYAQYLDQWSMYDVFEEILPRYITTNNENNAILSWCELPQDNMWLKTEFKKPLRQGSDKRWLYSTVFQAVRYWEMMPYPSIVLVSRYVIEGMVLEREVEESASMLPDHSFFQYP